MGVSGDFGALSRLVDRLGATEDEVERIVDDLRGDVTDLYQESFAAQRSPMGDAWERTQSGGPALFQTGALANPAVSVVGNKVKAKVTPYYGVFHQGGWKTGGERAKTKSRKTARVGGRQAGPARPILPPNGEAGTWESPLETSIDKALTKHLSGD